MQTWGRKRVRWLSAVRCKVAHCDAHHKTIMQPIEEMQREDAAFVERRGKNETDYYYFGVLQKSLFALRISI